MVQENGLRERLALVYVACGIISVLFCTCTRAAKAQLSMAINEERQCEYRERFEGTLNEGHFAVFSAGQFAPSTQVIDTTSLAVADLAVAKSLVRERDSKLTRFGDLVSWDSGSRRVEIFSVPFKVRGINAVVGDTVVVGTELSARDSNSIAGFGIDVYSLTDGIKKCSLLNPKEEPGVQIMDFDLVPGTSSIVWIKETRKKEMGRDRVDRVLEVYDFPAERIAKSFPLESFQGDWSVSIADVGTRGNNIVLLSNRINSRSASDSYCEIWDLERGAMVSRGDLPKGVWQSAAIVCDGEAILVVGYLRRLGDGTSERPGALELIDRRTGHWCHELQLKAGVSPSCCLVRPDGKAVVFCGANTAYVIEFKNDER